MAISDWPEHLRDDYKKGKGPNRTKRVRVSLESMVLRVTDKSAGLAESETDDIWIWVPFSQCAEAGDWKLEQWVHDAVIPLWLAVEHDLEYEEIDE